MEDEEYLSIASLNSWLEKGGQSIIPACGISLRNPKLMDLFSAKLYELWSTCQSLGRVLHRWLLNEMVSMAGKDFFLTQFIRSQGLLFDDTISYILSSKNFLLVSFKVDLYAFQLGRLPCALECFVMHFILEC